MGFKPDELTRLNRKEFGAVFEAPFKANKTNERWIGYDTNKTELEYSS